MIGKVAGVGLGTLCSQALVPIPATTYNVGNTCFHLLTIRRRRTERSERQTPVRVDAPERARDGTGSLSKTEFNRSERVSRLLR